MKRIPCVLIALLLLALVVPGCSGLDPKLMELGVKPLANFAADANAAVPDVQATVNAAKAHAATLAEDERLPLEASISKVVVLFDLPVDPDPNVPHLLQDLDLGGKKLMENIRKAGE